ncbi:hypothetical protein N7466_010259 [Penicillium verhagenii]|uniref:uncharacterized protein n=1 Tax=Penicillium verhagenii TaxID=1562060 RepID=UPI0025452FFA|nr:uncharacterized protein N7466_010259 [Penicillium verhagenii]KAJ5919316.1 hypothetical protein N7466_010259 [Penicillium verhagenii]
MPKNRVISPIHPRWISPTGPLWFSVLHNAHRFIATAYLQISLTPGNFPSLRRIPREILPVWRKCETDNGSGTYLEQLPDLFAFDSVTQRYH